MNYCSVSSVSLFGNCLYELSVSELLTLKHSLDQLNPHEKSRNDQINNETITDIKQVSKNGSLIDCEHTHFDNCLQPSSLALISEGRSYESVHETNMKEKPSKLQTFFHISVTALAFLSFGGYLLCLIVHSMKNKGNSYFISKPWTTPTAARRIKIYRKIQSSTTISTVSNFHSDLNIPYNSNVYWQHLSNHNYGSNLDY